MKEVIEVKSVADLADELQTTKSNLEMAEKEIIRLIRMLSNRHCSWMEDGIEGCLYHVKDNPFYYDREVE